MVSFKVKLSIERYYNADRLQDVFNKIIKEFDNENCILIEANVEDLTAPSGRSIGIEDLKVWPDQNSPEKMAGSKR